MPLESLFAQLFLKLQEKIAAIPGIKWVDQDLGQLEWYEQRPAVAFPCVLIDFNQTNYNSMQGNQQWGDLAFTLRLGFADFSAANSAAPTSVKEKSLNYYELEHALYKAIHGFDADGLIQPATRLNALTERREGDNFRVRIMTFTTSFQDESAMIDYTPTAADMDLDLDLEDEP